MPISQDRLFDIFSGQKLPSLQTEEPAGISTRFTFDPAAGVDQWSDLIDEESRKYTNVDTDLVKAIMKQESGGNPEAGSPAGAKGLMQLMDETAASLGVDDSLDPQQNVMGGVKLISILADKYDNDIPKILAAYNGGESGVDRAVEKYGDDWLSHLNEFKGTNPRTGKNHAEETWDYIERITDTLGTPVQSPEGGFRAVKQTSMQRLAEIFGVDLPATEEAPAAPEGKPVTPPAELTPEGISKDVKTVEYEEPKKKNLFSKLKEIFFPGEDKPGPVPQLPEDGPGKVKGGDVEVVSAEIPIPEDEVDVKKEGSVKGLLSRMVGMAAENIGIAPGFVASALEGITEIIVDKQAQLDPDVKHFAQVFVDSEDNFSTIQNVKKKYADKFKINPKQDKKALQLEFIKELNQTIIDEGKKFASTYGIDEKEFIRTLNYVAPEKSFNVGDIYDNPVTRFAENILKKHPSPEQIFGGGIVDTFKKSPVQGLQYMGLAGLENAGNMVLFAVNAPTGLGLIGLGSAGQRDRELRERDIRTGNRLINASAMGAAEAIPEMFGSAAIVGRLKTAFLKAAKESGEKVAKEGMRTVIGNMFKNFGKEWGVEFTEENITSITQIYTDIATGIDEDDAKKRLKTYITNEVPELLGATWVGGAAGVVRTGVESRVLQPESIETEVTPEGLEILPGGKERIEGRIEAEKAKEKAKEKPTTKVPVVEKLPEFEPVKGEKKGGPTIFRAKGFKSIPEIDVDKAGPIEYNKIKEQLPSEQVQPRKQKPVEQERKRLSEIERNQIGAESKAVDKDAEITQRDFDTNIQKLEQEKSEVEFASDLRSELSKEFTGDQWKRLIGAKTEVKWTPETQKKLEKIADSWTTAKKSGRDQIFGKAPPEHVLNDRSIDEFGPEDVENVIRMGFNQKDLQKYRSAWNAKSDKIESEYEKAIDDLTTLKGTLESKLEAGKPIERSRFDEVELKTEVERPGEFFDEGAEEFNFGANIKGDDPELFKVEQRPGILESEKGAVDVSAFKSEGAKKAANAFSKFVKRNFTVKGDLPDPAFEANIKREGLFRAELKAIQHNVNKFKKVAKKAYKTRKLTSNQKFEIDEVFKGAKPITTLPKELRPIVENMRAHTDAMSKKLIDMGVVEGDLSGVVKQNLGYYANRSYRVFDDPKWAKKVPVETRNRAKAFIRNEYPDLKEEEVLGLIDELLYKEKAPINVLQSGSKLGSKNLGILKRRKDIPAEIRALWGEYKDADVNYANSVAKMANLMANHQFLNEVAAAGTDRFFFKNPITKGDQSFSAKISSEGNPALKPLDGMYTTPEIKKAFEDAVGKSDTNSLFRGYMKVNSAVKYAKTVGSLMTHIRNTTGNIGFALANGHFNVGSAPKALKTVLADVRGKGTDEMNAYVRELTELGVIGEGARAGELRDIINDATQGNIDVLIGEGPRHFAQKALKATEKAYGAEDDVWKIFAFENEMKRYRKAFPDMSEKQLKKKVATIVRNTYPTYSMIPRGIKNLRKFPLVGTFVSFPSEVIRTGKNTIRLIGEEWSDKRTRGIAAQRIVGVLTAASIMGVGAAVTRYRTGVDKDEDEAYREFMPPWSENSHILWLGQDDQGRMSYIDLGYSDPHSYLKNPVIAFMRGEDWEKSLYASVGELMAPFLTEEILAGKVADIWRNKTKDGRPVWNRQDSDLNKTKDILSHFTEAIEPGTITGLRRMYKAMNDGSGKFGTTYDAKTEAVAQTTGVRVSKVDVRKALIFKTLQFKDDLNDARKLAHKRGSASTIAKNRVIFDRFAKTIRKAMITGVSTDEIVQILIEAGIPKRTAFALSLGDYEGELERKASRFDK